MLVFSCRTGLSSDGVFSKDNLPEASIFHFFTFSDSGKNAIIGKRCSISRNSGFPVPEIPAIRENGLFEGTHHDK
jgi:hypothetical protein